MVSANIYAILNDLTNVVTAATPLYTTTDTDTVYSAVVTVSLHWWDRLRLYKY